MLAGLIAPDRGAVLLDGREPASLLGAVGLMGQRDLLMPWRSTLRNVTLGLELAGLSRASASERALAEFERFGLAGFEDRWPSALSGGMRQRAALLRTFLAGRDVLLLDEPFASLDALTREQMGEWLLGVWEADRKTVLLVTHDVREAVFLSDRVYVLTGRPGRLGEPVTIDLPRPRRVELTASARFAELEAQLLAPLRRAARELAWSGS